MVQWYGAFRPAIMGGRAMVSSTHYLATAAGVEILKAGGNATDAGVAVGLCINVLEPHLTNFGGVAPIMTWDASARRVETISGLGRWPAAISIDWYNENFGGDMPEGIARTVTPAAAAAWLDALARHGTMTFAQVVAPALALAEGGFPLYPRLAATFANEAATVGGWPSSVDTFLPGGRPPREREIWRQPDLATTFRRLCEAERGAANREAGLEAARRRFYEGDLAEAMARHSAAEGGLLTGDDLARFRVGHEAPVSTGYREYEVFACGPWCQGPVIPQALGILAQDDLAALGHNSADYLHLVAEALKLAFADRDRFYGDPDFVTVPLEGLLSPTYAAARRAQIDPARAWAEMPPSGDPRPFMSPNGHDLDVSARRPVAIAAPPGPDTAYCCVVDEAGNAFSATPSDGALTAPLVPGLGIPLSTRGSQGWLDPAHPAAVAPNKRPRLTPNPALALREGELFMPFGCPGGDGQTQAMLQVFLNVAAFGMNPQRAISVSRRRSSVRSGWPVTGHAVEGEPRALTLIGDRPCNGGIMLVRAAKAAARRWVAAEATALPGFAGAFFHGSTNWMSEEEPFPTGSDLDVMLVLDGPSPATKLGKFVYDCVLLEVSHLTRAQLGTADDVLGQYHLAGSFCGPSIIADPLGILTPLHEAVAREYARRPWIQARCAHAREKALHGLLLDAAAPFHDQVNAWLFPNGIATHVLLVAGLRNPTVRRRYAAVRELLYEYGHAAFYETLLDQLDPDAMTPERATEHLAALSAAFDAAARVIRSPFFFAADITAQGHPVAIGGSAALIATGQHREALFWMVATYCRCMAVCAQDGTPELHARHDPGFRRLLADLGIVTSDDLRRRKDALPGFMPQVWAVAEAIMAANRAITE